MDGEIRKRLRWVELDEQFKNFSVVALKCGISRPTLRKWVRRYEKDGVAGLASQSRRAKNSPATRIGDRERDWILEFRKRRLGSRRIQNELGRAHSFEVSRTMIDKVLSRADARPLFRARLNRKQSNRYAKDVPGARLQMDTCKIGPGLYQYTAVDDCTRIRVLALYSRRTAKNTLVFLEKVIEELPFPIQRIQTDRGREFFAHSVQQRLREYGIKFRPREAGFSSPERESGAIPANGFRGVLCNCGSEGGRFGYAAFRVAGSLQPFPVTRIIGRPNTLGEVAGTRQDHSLLGRCRGQL